VCEILIEDNVDWGESLGKARTTRRHGDLQELWQTCHTVVIKAGRGTWRGRRRHGNKSLWREWNERRRRTIINRTFRKEKKIARKKSFRTSRTAKEPGEKIREGGEKGYGEIYALREGKRMLLPEGGGGRESCKKEKRQLPGEGVGLFGGRSERRRGGKWNGRWKKVDLFTRGSGTDRDWGGNDRQENRRNLNTRLTAGWR